jgi:hypothetical protein
VVVVGRLEFGVDSCEWSLCRCNDGEGAALYTLLQDLPMSPTPHGSSKISMDDVAS